MVMVMGGGDDDGDGDVETFRLVDANFADS